MADPPQAVETSAPTAAGHGKASLGKRLIAAVIDWVIAILVTLVPVIGGVVGAAYMLFRDGFEFDFMDRRSLGKKVMNLRPVTLDGSPVDLSVSATRNWMFAVGPASGALVSIPSIGILFIPVVLLVSLAGMVIGIVEFILIFTNDEGRRWGDHLASTKVIESND